MLKRVKDKTVSGEEEDGGEKNQQPRLLVVLMNLQILRQELPLQQVHPAFGPDEAPTRRVQTQRLLMLMHCVFLHAPRQRLQILRLQRFYSAGMSASLPITCAVI